MKTSHYKMFDARRLLSVAIAVAVLGAGAQATFAQVHQVQLGGAMDSNPNVGSGGSNRPIQGYVPVPLNGNEIITGNVSGLAYFHARTATFSPFTFQAPLGSSALAGFARQSAGGGIGGSPLGQVYYLPSSTVSTAQGALHPSPSMSGFDSALVPRAAISPTASSVQLQSLARSEGQVGTQLQGSAYDRFATVPVEPGAPGAVLSSPLFAMRVDEMLKNEPKNGELNPGLVGEPTMPAKNGADVNTMDDPTKMRPASRNDTVDQEVTGRSDPRVLGQSLDVRTARIGPRDKPEVDERVDDTYHTLLGDLQRAEAQAKGGTGETVLAGTNTVHGSNMVNDIDPLTGGPRRTTLLERLPTTNPASRPATTGPGSDRISIRTPSAVPTKRLDELPLEKLAAGSHVKPLSTLVQPRSSGETTPVDVLMTQAEKQLQSGKYLEAAQSYQAAIGEDPSNLLALVGRSIAETGAGMFQSGAYDLKFAFTRNPQMISVHYDLGKFIAPERQEALVKDLTALSEKKDSGNVASFLLCFLHFQNNRSQALSAELKKWGERDHDQWQSVLSRAWTATASDQK